MKKKITTLICFLVVFVALFSSTIGYAKVEENTASLNNNMVEQMAYHDVHAISSSIGSSIGAVVFFAFGFAIFCLVMAVLSIKKKKKAKMQANSPVSIPNEAFVSNHTAEITIAIKERDSAFDPNLFSTYVTEVFTTLFQAQLENNMEAARPFLTEELFQMQNQRWNLVNQAGASSIDQINFNKTYFYNYIREEEYEYLTAFLSTSSWVPVVDKHGNLSGKGAYTLTYNYLLVFRRILNKSANVNNDPAKKYKCPNCGGPIASKRLGKCEYCGFIFDVAEDRKWLLSSFSEVIPGTVYSQGGVFYR